MEITYEVTPTFARVHRDKSRFIFIMGPVNSGKSTGCLFHLFLNALKQKPDASGVRRSRYAVIRATYPQLRSSIVKTAIQWFKDKLQLVYSTPITGRIKYDLEDGTKLDMEMMFIAIEDDTSVEKLRSWEFTGAYVNEGHEIPEYLISMLSMRTDRFPAIKDGGAVDPCVIVDYNAVSTDHWLYKMAEETKPSGFSFYRQPAAIIQNERGEYEVNPEAENLANLSEDYYKNILAASSPETINTDLMNNYGERKSGKPVYKDFSDSEHTALTPFTPARGMPVIIGLDQGLTPSAVFTQMMPDGTVHVFDEITTEDCSLREFAEEWLWPRITTKYPHIVDNFAVVCDPATNQRSQNDAKSGMDILRDAALPVRSAKSNVPTERREAVIHYLRLKNRFRLSPTCKVLRKGFISDYKYAKSRTVNGIIFKEVPDKNYASHVHDALQYAMMEYIHRRPRKSFKGSSKPSYRAASSIGGY